MSSDEKRCEQRAAAFKLLNTTQGIFCFALLQFVCFILFRSAVFHVFVPAITPFILIS